MQVHLHTPHRPHAFQDRKGCLDGFGLWGSEDGQVPHIPGMGVVGRSTTYSRLQVERKVSCADRVPYAGHAGHTTYATDEQVIPRLGFPWYTCICMSCICISRRPYPVGLFPVADMQTVLPAHGKYQRTGTQVTIPYMPQYRHNALYVLSIRDPCRVPDMGVNASCGASWIPS